METEIGESEPVSTAVIRAVSAVNGRKPASLRPLSDVVDPAALDALFDFQSDDGARTEERLSFSYSGCLVTIENDELLTIEQLETTDRASARSDGTDRAERSRSGTERPTTERTPGSRVCVVCQQPIARANIGRERGELVHEGCRAQARCGISVERDV